MFRSNVTKDRAGTPLNQENTDLTNIRLGWKGQTVTNFLAISAVTSGMMRESLNIVTYGKFHKHVTRVHCHSKISYTVFHDISMKCNGLKSALAYFALAESYYTIMI
jgi:hypothetical protein